MRKRYYYQHQRDQVAKAARLVVHRPEGMLEFVARQAATNRTTDKVIAVAFDGGLSGSRINHLKINKFLIKCIVFIKNID
jgi:hypothetical protein